MVLTDLGYVATVYVALLVEGVDVWRPVQAADANVDAALVIRECSRGD